MFKNKVMADSAKKIWKQEYNRLKKVFEKMIRPKKESPQPQFALQPIRTKKYLRLEAFIYIMFFSVIEHSMLIIFCCIKINI